MRERPQRHPTKVWLRARNVMQSGDCKIVVTSSMRSGTFANGDPRVYAFQWRGLQTSVDRCISSGRDQNEFYRLFRGSTLPRVTTVRKCLRFQWHPVPSGRQQFQVFCSVSGGVGLAWVKRSGPT